MAKVTEANEINMHIENLIAAWGQVIIECTSEMCSVSDRTSEEQNIFPFRSYSAPTVLEALREAAQD